MDVNNNFELYHNTLTNILSDINTRLKNSESRKLVDKGTISSGETVNLNFMESDTQKFTVRKTTNSPITINFVGSDPSAFLTMFLQIDNAGNSTLIFPEIRWTLSDGTYTTTISDYLSKIDRDRLSVSGPTWFSIWKAGTILYGKIL